MIVVNDDLNSSANYLHLAKIAIFAVKIRGHCQAVACFDTAKIQISASHPAVTLSPDAENSLIVQRFRRHAYIQSFFLPRESINCAKVLWRFGFVTSITEQPLLSDWTYYRKNFQALTMRIALFPDVYANLPAFEKVLEDIKNQKPDAVYCLGDGGRA